MKTLLVPVDFSAVSGKVIETALALARAFQSRVTLLHVIQPPVVGTGDYALPSDVVEQAMKTTRLDTQRKLNALGDVFQQAGIEFAVADAIGSPERAILEHIAKTDADCVIMGSHGHGKLYDFLVGSTASGVIKHTKCAVLIVPPADK
ncbi:MAG TPA: universal stress protein [Lacunisphaera sp.]|nr:universal stress protein [Lacunisphaera sp.]